MPLAAGIFSLVVLRVHLSGADRLSAPSHTWSGKMKISNNDLLLVIDVQNDFCPGGALAVNEGDTIVPIINHLIDQFPNVALTQDWHPAAHSSFASHHPGHDPFSTISMPYGDQTLWPDHCIQGSNGAEFHHQLNTAPASLVIRKGLNPAIDSYSAFYENDKKTSTGLSGYLREKNIKRVFCTGLALDFCVFYSAQDACREKFETFVITDACRAIDMDGSAAAATSEMVSQGVSLMQSNAFLS